MLPCIRCKQTTRPYIFFQLRRHRLPFLFFNLQTQKSSSKYDAMHILAMLALPARYGEDPFNNSVTGRGRTVVMPSISAWASWTAWMPLSMIGPSHFSRTRTRSPPTSRKYPSSPRAATRFHARVLIGLVEQSAEGLRSVAKDYGLWSAQLRAQKRYLTVFSSPLPLIWQRVPSTLASFLSRLHLYCPPASPLFNSSKHWKQARRLRSGSIPSRR